MRLRSQSDDAVRHRRIRPPEPWRKPVRPADGTPGASLRQMLDVISHELRSPLNVIQSWSHVLENELSRTLAEESGRDSAIEPSPAAQRALAGIRIGVREQVRLIDQLLDATRAINGRLTMERRPFALVPVLESAVSGVQPQATERGLTLHLDYQCPDCHVEGDAERLRQSFSHLLSNAIKFSPEQGDVQVTLRREGGELVISVIDQGPGVAPELRQEIFEWFRRGDRRQGLGLGLALSRHFARAHGGDIEVFSEAPGRGSTFTLRLPEWRPSTLAAANEEPASAPPGDRAAPPDRAPPAGPTLPASAD